MDLLLAPHNDDEALFASFTLIRRQPLVVVVTDSFVQERRDSSVTWQRRRKESIAACALLGCAVTFLGVRDDDVNEHQVVSRLLDFQNFETIYVPALQHGHPHHDVVHRAARAVFRDAKVFEYCTYSPNSPSYANVGATAVIGDSHEWELKRQALKCYPSQVWSKHHFSSVLDKPEWLTPWS